MKKPQSVKAQFALLAHIYKLEIIELCEMSGLWLVGVAEDLSALVWSIACYDIRHHHHHRRHR